MSNSGKYKVILTGGGTGGHLFPLLAIVRELKRFLPQESLEISYLGPEDEISKEYMKKEGVAVKYVFSGKIRRYKGVKPFFENILDIFFKIPFGIIQSFFYLYFFSPDIVFSKGGYGSFPAVITARIFQVPVILHESDAISGMANRFLQRFAAEVFTSFPKTEGVNTKKMFVVGNPVREKVIGGEKEEAKRFLKARGEKPAVLILGGSQGSERINDLFLSSSTGFLKEFEVFHQCGKKNYKQVSVEAQATISSKELKENYHVYPFLDEESLKQAYALADIVISRAGSGSIFEIAANKKGGVFVPLPEAAQDHQVKNAYAYASSRAAVVLEEENLTPHFFLGKIKELFSPYEQIKVMEKRAGEFARPRAAHIIASYIKEYLTQ